MAMEEEPLRTGFDPNDRDLCPDGACIGVIGPDGRCAECGKPSGKPSTGKGARGTAMPASGAEPLGSTGPDDARAASADSREVEGDEFDPARRELCSDGACIGVIGADGRCAECGKPSRARPPSADQSAPPADRGRDDENDADPAPRHRDGTDDDPPDIEQRVLCPDGTCVGVIGSNGRCKVCGTRAE